MIRKDEDWVNILDERILEYLLDYGPSCPTILAASKGIKGSKGEVQNRCEKLDEESLILKTDEGDWRITEVGKSYLEGVFDLKEGIVVEYIGSHHNWDKGKLHIRVPHEQLADYCSECEYLPSPS